VRKQAMTDASPPAEQAIEPERAEAALLLKDGGG